MATTSDIRNGLCMVFKDALYVVVEFQHVKPGKGPAFVRTKLKNVKTGKVIDNTFSAGHKIETARVETHRFQFLYRDDLGFHFMHNETYEQITLAKEMVPNPDLLKDGENVEMLIHSETDTPLTCVLPKAVELQVVYTEPGLKGDTATNATKPAKMETGAEIQVPLFINEGEKIKIDTINRSYMERVKS